ncbi:MAG TPA: ABC transporter ATP-binding protein [Nitrosomonas mobilis]|nr:ABC transporter ATP-binding protein [Nitrosomonas mobilis]
MTNRPSFSQPTSFRSNLLQWLRESETPYWQFLSIVFFSASVTAISITLIPLVIGQLSTHVLPGGNRLFLHELPLLLAILLLTSITANYAGNYTLHRLQGQFALILRDRLLAQLVGTTPNCTDISSEWIKLRYFGTVDSLLNYLIRLINSLSRDLLTVIGLVAVLLYMNQELALLTLVVLAVALLTQSLFSTDTASQTLSDKTQNEITNLIQNVIAYQHLIRLDHGCLQERLNIYNILDQQQRISLRQTGHSMLTGMLAQLFLIGLMTALLYFWLQQMTLGKFMPGEMPAFIAALLILTLPLKRLLAIKRLLVDSHQSYQPIAAILSIPHAPAKATSNDLSANRIRRLQGSVYFENVHFYCNASQSRLASCPDFSLIPGEILAITNFTSDSAQILASLVCGFVSPITGKVMLDKQNAVDIDQLVRQTNVAWLSPDRMLLSDTVAANIAYGMKRCSVETEITRAAHASHATEFIRELPRGHETILDTGITLTASERQRLLIARALLKNPAIVIIDESIVQFDLNDPLLQQALLALTRKRTTLILSTQPPLLNLAENSITL